MTGMYDKVRLWWNVLYNTECNYQMVSRNLIRLICQRHVYPPPLLRKDHHLDASIPRWWSVTVASWFDRAISPEHVQQDLVCPESKYSWIAAAIFVSLLTFMFSKTCNKQNNFDCIWATQHNRQKNLWFKSKMAVVSSAMCHLPTGPTPPLPAWPNVTVFLQI